jgi:hypothetical protein
MSPFGFEDIWTKVKITGALPSESLSAQLLENALVNNLDIWY